MTAAAAWVGRTRLLLILDAATLDRQDLRAAPVAATVLSACPPGAVTLVDRDNTATPDRARLARLRRLASIAVQYRAALVVGGRPDLAAALDTARVGVQLPESGLPAEVVRSAFPTLAIGRSCHDRRGLLEAAAAGADWATLAPVFMPIARKNQLSRPPHGEHGLRQALEGVVLPVFALGGVDVNTASSVEAAGAAGAACIGAVLGACDPGAAAESLLRALQPLTASKGAS